MHSAQSIEGSAPVVTKVSHRDRLERGLRVSFLVAFSAVLIFGPLALGAVQDWSIAIFEASAAAVLLIWMAWRLSANEIVAPSAARTPRIGSQFGVRWNPLFAPMLVFLGLVLVQIAFHRSAYLYDSLAELWLLIAYGILAFTSVQLRHDLVALFANTIVVFGSLYAVFAVLQGFTSNGKIYWLIKPRTGSVYGSYVNHNHYAGLMELLLPMALVLALDPALRREKRVLLACATVTMAASVFLSQSRGGMIAVIVEMVFLGIIWRIQFSPRKSATVFVAFSITTALFLAWVAPQELGSRITDIHDPARLLIHRDSIRMFLAHPFLGSGFGTFATAFPHYRVFYDGFFMDNAHDDYLELLLETGLIGFGVGVWFLVVLYGEGVRNIHLIKNLSSARISTAALAGCTGLLAHSFLDFNLHIPANAALFYVLCVIATASSGSGRGNFNSPRARIPFPRSWSR
jgi:O-antigen ligase